MFRKLPVLLLASLLLLFFINPWIPISLKEVMYAFSLSIKSLIIFMLPALIFMILFKTIVQFARSATKVLIILLIAICCSNFFSTLISYFVGSAIYHVDFSLISPSAHQGLVPAWNFQCSQWIPNDWAMMSALFLGILCTFFRSPWINKITWCFDRAVQFLLKLFFWAVPLFLLGFAVKMFHEKTLQSMVSEYSFIFLIVALSQFSYLALLLFFANRMRWREVWESWQNILPAAAAGLSSMSSAAAMPFTIVGAEKNTKNVSFARFAIPLTVNVHLIGDCLAIPIFAFAIMHHFGMAAPSAVSYLVFAFYFVIAKFSVAAVPGGGILVMLPILEGHLGFTPEMASLITALYILFDPIITCANVIGNSTFVILMNKLLFKKSIA